MTYQPIDDISDIAQQRETLGPHIILLFGRQSESKMTGNG